MKNIHLELRESVVKRANGTAKTNGEETGAHLSLSVIKQVKKRDGRIVEFDLERIVMAAHKAIESVGEGDRSVAVEVAGRVHGELVQKVIEVENFVPEVEGIQDLVEKYLILAGLPKAAKSFILYRYEHSLLRDEEKVRGILDGKFTVVKRDGTREALDLSQIRKAIEEVFVGFEGDVDTKEVANEVLEEVTLSLFEGMTTKEINKTIVLTLRSRIERDEVYSKISARFLLNDLYKEILGLSESSKNFEYAYRETFEKKIKHGVSVGRFDKRLLGFNFKKLESALVPKRDFILSYFGAETLKSRYFVEDYEKNILELPQYFWMRIAMGLCLNEKNKEEKAIEFYNLMSELYYLPSTPTLFQAGTVYPQLSSCFLNSVSDDLTDIFKTYGDNSQLAKFSGGIGTDWTFVRGTGANIKTTNVPSQGVIPFLKISDATTAAINRSGKRRGASVIYLETWHWDIESFLELRKNTGDERRRTHDTNTANWIPDLFMKRVIADEGWTLFSPDETPDLHDLYGNAFEERYEHYENKAERGKIKLFKRIRARDLWRKMLTMLYETGHPWMVFKDPCNIRSPQDHVGVVHSSNLCTEITLNTSSVETAVCNLGSINLVRHIKDGVINKSRLTKTISTAMRMLDNVIDINFYPIPEAKNSNTKHRPVGLGVMGLTDVFFEMGLPFDSDRAVRVSDEIMEFISYKAILSSSLLAQERGSYKSFKGSKWDRGLMPYDTQTLLEEERGQKLNVPRGSKLNWGLVRKHIKKHGMRNSNCMAIAPTSNLANVAGCVAFSIEPVFKNLFVESNVVGEFTMLNKYLVTDLKKEGLWGVDMLNKIKRHDGSIQDIDEIPTPIKEKYKEAFEIDPYWVVRHASVRAKWLDQSQSINIFTKTTSGKSLGDIYLAAWKSGLKSTYYLRTLGATSVEKATLELSESSTGSVTTKREIEEQQTSEALACLIGEDCDACQ